MELRSIKLIDGRILTVGENEVLKIFMANNDLPITFVTLSDESQLKIPYHSVLYWV